MLNCARTFQEYLLNTSSEIHFFPRCPPTKTSCTTCSNEIQSCHIAQHSTARHSTAQHGIWNSRRSTQRIGNKSSRTQSYAVFSSSRRCKRCKTTYVLSLAQRDGESGGASYVRSLMTWPIWPCKSSGLNVTNMHILRVEKPMQFMLILHPWTRCARCGSLCSNEDSLFRIYLNTEYKRYFETITTITLLSQLKQTEDYTCLALYSQTRGREWSKGLLCRNANGAPENWSWSTICHLSTVYVCMWGLVKKLLSPVMSSPIRYEITQHLFLPAVNKEGAKQK